MDLPKCKLCGAAPIQSADYAWCGCHGAMLLMADWRRLHGPRLAPEHVEALRAISIAVDKPVRDAIRAALKALGEGQG